RRREPEVSRFARRTPDHRARGLGRDPARHPVAATGLEGDARDLQGHDLSSVSGDRGLDDAGRKAAGRRLADRARTWFRVRGFRQYPAHRAGAEAGRLRLGLSRLRGRVWRIDDLVRLVGWRGL